MPTVQELLTEMRQHTEEPPTEQQLQAVVDAVLELDELLVAFFSPTKHYFITKEQDAPTAVIFSNRDSFERFAERCKEQGTYTAALVNHKDDRKLLFIDFVRCGFTHVLIDYAPAFLVLPVTAFGEIPDFSVVPLIKRPFFAPALTGKILYLFQQIHSGKADGGIELDVLRELYHSPMLMPVEVFEAEGGTGYLVPDAGQDGKRTAHLFTDRFEWERFGVSTEFSPAIARYPEMQTLLESGFERLVINPGSGAELVLDAALLTAAEQAVMGNSRVFEIKTMQEQGEKLSVTEPEQDSAALIQALTDVLKQHEAVAAAYLRLLKRENVLRPSYLVLLDADDDRGKKTLHEKLSAAAQPHLGNHDIEFTDYRSALEFAGNAKPFYRRKKRILFR